MTSGPCPDCGPAQANHTALWVVNSGDVVSMWLSGSISPFFRFTSYIATAILPAIERIGYSVARAVGAVTLSDDIEQTASRRSKLLWLEARKRGISMHQLFLFGKRTDSFLVRMNGKDYFFKSLPLAPLGMEALRMDDKVLFKHAMRNAGLPVPKSYGVADMQGATKALAELGLVCVKPRSSSNARHTYPYVQTEEELKTALEGVHQICAFASVEEHLEGNLARATCVDGKLVGFLASEYPTVVGDGVSTIAELVEGLNAQKPEGVGDIVLDGSHEGYIRRRGYEFSDVLPGGTSLPLTYRAGSSLGGRNRELGRGVHPSFIPIIEAAARLTELSIVGFDLIVPDPLAPEDSQRWGFIEANTLPWIDLHSAPFYGAPIDVSPFVWDLWLSTISDHAPDTR